MADSNELNSSSAAKVAPNTYWKSKKAASRPLHLRYLYAIFRPNDEAGRESVRVAVQNYGADEQEYLHMKHKRRGKYEAQWNLCHRPHSKSPISTLTIGTGSSGQGASNNIDIMIDYRNVALPNVCGVNALLRMHPTSGLLMIGGVSDDHLIQCTTKRKVVSLGKEQWHGLGEPINDIRINGMSFVLVYSELDEQELKDLREARNNEFKVAGLTAPDARLPLLPLNPICRMKDVLAFSELGKGTFGVVFTAIDIESGEPCAVKKVATEHFKELAEFMNEAEVLFKFPGQQTVMQASHIYCKHGKCFDGRSSGDVRATFRKCGFVDEFFVIQPLAKSDFSKIKTDMLTNPRDILNLLMGPLEGLKILHAAGYLHRDVTTRNMLVMPGNRGVIADHGKAVKALTHTHHRTAPAMYRAPEMDGRTPYGSAADVWSAGIALSKIILGTTIRKMKTWKYAEPQSKAWTERIHIELDNYCQKSELHNEIGVRVKAMLTYNAKDRPSMKTILGQGLGKHPRDDDDTEDEGQPAKALKTSEANKKPESGAELSRRIRKTKVKYRPMGSVNTDWNCDEENKQMIEACTALNVRRGPDGKTVYIFPPYEDHNADLDLDALAEDREERKQKRIYEGFIAVNAPGTEAHHTVQHVRDKATASDPDEEASTEILSLRNDTPSAGGPDWNKSPPAGLTADGGSCSHERDTEPGHWTEVESYGS